MLITKNQAALNFLTENAELELNKWVKTFNESNRAGVADRLVNQVELLCDDAQRLMTVLPRSEYWVVVMKDNIEGNVRGIAEQMNEV